MKAAFGVVSLRLESGRRSVVIGVLRQPGDDGWSWSAHAQGKREVGQSATWAAAQRAAFRAAERLLARRVAR